MEIALNQGNAAEGFTRRLEIKSFLRLLEVINNFFYYIHRVL